MTGNWVRPPSCTAWVVVHMFPVTHSSYTKQHLVVLRSNVYRSGWNLMHGTWGGAIVPAAK